MSLYNDKSHVHKGDKTFAHGKIMDQGNYIL